MPIRLDHLPYWIAQWPASPKEDRSERLYYSLQYYCSFRMGARLRMESMSRSQRECTAWCASKASKSYQGYRIVCRYEHRFAPHLPCSGRPNPETRQLAASHGGSRCIHYTFDALNGYPLQRFILLCKVVDPLLYKQWGDANGK
jgi:hypothetical protein